MIMHHLLPSYLLIQSLRFGNKTKIFSKIVIETVCNNCICGETIGDNNKFLDSDASLHDCARLVQEKGASETFELWDSGSCSRCLISQDPTNMMVLSNPVSVYRVTSGKTSYETNQQVCVLQFLFQKITIIRRLYFKLIHQIKYHCNGSHLITI